MTTPPPTSTNTVWHHATVTRTRREQQNGHKSAVLWFTGLSGAGKSTSRHCERSAAIQHLYPTMPLAIQ